MNTQKPKVFGIGFHKTGTSSLAAALKHLGYSVTGPNGVDDPDIAGNVLDLVRDLVPRYDAFQDNPWPIVFRDLDAWYPDALFVLTLRDPDRWIRSQVRHFGTTDTPMRQWIYGVGHPKGHEATYLDRYRTHNEDVIAHFRDRPGKLLVMDLEKGDGWAGLCAHLGHPAPDIPFPHENRNATEAGAKARPGLIGRLLGLLRR